MIAQRAKKKIAAQTISFSVGNDGVRRIAGLFFGRCNEGQEIDHGFTSGGTGDEQTCEQCTGSQRVGCRRAADQTNFRRMKTTKPMRASASVKAMPRNIVVCTWPADSG